jgi:hypothetical protein
MLLIAAIGVGACGHKHSDPSTADTEGPYVRAGQVTYQVQLSRQLNQYSVEDRGYLAGFSGPAPTSSEEWLAVFLWAKNETHTNQTTTDSFDIVDTAGNRYHPVALNPSANPYAWTSQTLRPLGIEPPPDSTASFGPTQGGLVLFKLGAAVYSNRPLTLEIFAPGQANPTTISLDL